MRIPEIRTIPLSAATQDTGWPSGTDAEDILVPAFRLDADGMLRVPTGPGLGGRRHPDALARYTR